MLNKKPLQNSNVIRSQHLLLHGLDEIYNYSSLEEWENFIPLVQSHPTKNILHECPLTRRIFEKPRGYAGDAVVLDYIYFGVNAEDSKNITERGQMLSNFLNETPASSAVRNRARKIGSILDNFPFTESGKIKILSLACGHLRELSTSKRFIAGECDFVALDQDAKSLAIIQRDYGHLGVQTVNAKIKKLLTDDGFIEQLGQFDFVYAAGLFDYLNDKTITQLMKAMYKMTKEGGLTLFTNFSTGIINRAHMESFMAWNLIYRTPHELLNLSKNIIPACHGQFYEEPSRNVVFLEFKKPLAKDLQRPLQDIRNNAPLLTFEQKLDGSFRGCRAKL